jgi:ferric-dicitrate binding protein FerR (iron transport regulator)
VIHRDADADHHLQPFIVHTAALDIVVTGTIFHVTAYHHTIRIELNKGRISIHFKDANLADCLLQPGEVLEYTGTGEPVIQPASK